MDAKHERKLRDLAKLAADVADLVHQNGDSPIGGGGATQVKVLQGLRQHGPDPLLEAIEQHGRALGASIWAYLAQASG